MTPTPLSLNLSLSLTLPATGPAPSPPLEAAMGAPALRLWCPSPEPPPAIPAAPPGGADTRSPTPGVPQESDSGPVQQRLFAETAVPPASSGEASPEESLLRRLAEQHQAGPQRVSAEDRDRLRLLLLDEVYVAVVEPHRQRLCAAGRIEPGTLAKDRQSLRRFRRWDSEHGRPDDWPDGVAWRGCPVGFLAAGYLDRCFAWLLGHYSADTVKSTRSHLAGVLNHLAAIGVLDEAPCSSPLDVRSADPPSLLAAADEDLATVWTPEELTRAEVALADDPGLQCAFVVGCCCGPRTHDLFQLRWAENLALDRDLPWIAYEAKKTRKRHGFPLMPVAAAYLRRWRDRLRREQLFEPAGLVFPELSADRERCRDPERSKAARRRTARVKRLLVGAGLPDYEKPWQVCRATCCSRVNDVDRRANIGSWMIGQGGVQRAGTRLAATYYDNPAQLAREIILRTPAPAGWSA